MRFYLNAFYLVKLKKINSGPFNISCRQPTLKSSIRKHHGILFEYSFLYLWRAINVGFMMAKVSPVEKRKRIMCSEAVPYVFFVTEYSNLDSKKSLAKDKPVVEADQCHGQLHIKTITDAQLLGNLSKS